MELNMRNRPWLVVILACVVLVLILGFIKFTQIRAAIAFGESFPEPSETVQTMKVEFAAWQPHMMVVGDVRASREVELHNELPGIIAKVGFVSGSLVEKGDLLLQLDVSEENAQLQGAQAELTLAAADYKRFAGFKDPDAVSRQQVDRAKAEFSMAEARVLAIQSVIDRKTILAPFKGFSSIHQFEPGQFLEANSMVTRLVGDTGDTWVDFAIPQQYVTIQPGSAVTISAQGSELNAKLIAVEQGVSRESRTVQMRAALDYGDTPLMSTPLMPGTIVSVSVPIGESIQTVSLPSSAVRVDTFGAYVFVLETDAEGKLRANRRPVTQVSKEGEFTVISEGLAAGEMVATKGAFKLREGIWVKQTTESHNGK
jgi:membrane fusion protein (multidrug efflux system)